jgi:membrane protease YdiL (CAAX protease family)
MRPLGAFLIYLAVVLAGGALLAPWLYWAAQEAASRWPPLEPLLQFGFHRYMNRALLVMALMGLWPLLRCLGARSLAELGLSNPGRSLGKLLSGFVLGFLSLAVVACLVLGAGGRAWDPCTLAQFIARLGKAGLTAAVVALLEEILFRGGLFGALRKACRWPVALLASSALYALVHFLDSAQRFPQVHWHSGFAALQQMAQGFGRWEALIPGFLNLWLAGLLLGLAYQRTGNLYFSIGLHAGWILWLKLYGFLTLEQPGACGWFWGTERLIDGWLTLIVLLLATLPLWHWTGTAPALASIRPAGAENGPNFSSTP